MTSAKFKVKTKMCGGKKFSDFQVDCLDAHNDYRSRHGVPALNLNEGLCKYAEDHAKFMSQCDSEKPSKSPYGENIFIKKSSKKIYPNAFEPVTQWYSEISQFDDQTSYPSKDIKHFVQVVWKETRSMGVGFAINQ